MLELWVSRTLAGKFYPVLIHVLREQEKGCHKIALYGAGLTTAPAGELFRCNILQCQTQGQTEHWKIYGSTSRIFRIFRRKNVYLCCITDW